VLVVDGGFAGVRLALACVHNTVVMGSRLRWDAARSHPPAPQSPGTRGRKPLKGKRQRRLQGWAERANTPWETGAVTWDGGLRKSLWVFSRTALGYTPGLPPVALRYGLVADPEGKLHRAAFCGTDRQATPDQRLAWVVMRWSGAGTVEEARVHVGFATQRQWAEQAMARTSPVWLALFSLVTVLALRLSHGGPLPGPVTAWYTTTAPTCAACLAVVRRHRWRARSLLHSTSEAEITQFPREALALLLQGYPLAA
jgi:hypothetical protein